MPGSAIPVPSPAAAAPSAEAPAAQILSLAQDGRGVARAAGKVVFIEGALPGELVEFQRWRHKPNFDLANLTRVLRESSARVVPRCPHYERCGGCSFQHLDPHAQVAVLPHVNHFGIFTDPVALQKISEWLRSLPADNSRPTR